MFEKFYNTPARTGFHWPGRIVAGEGTLAGWLSDVDGDIAVVADHVFAEHPIVQALGQAAVIVSGEPAAANVRQGLARLADRRPDIVLAIGGGATIDTAKALTAHLRCGTWSIRDRVRDNTAPRLVAAPTTAGSGSETSRFFIVADDATHTKQSVRSWSIVPDLTILDPIMLASASPRHLVLGALDASIHLWETHIARGERSVFTDGLAQGFVPRILAHLPGILSGAALTSAARLDLMQASAMAGMAISNVRTGLVHTLGESLAAHAALPHPMTLRVFLRPALESYAQFIQDHVQPLWSMADALAPWGAPWSTERFITAWEDAFTWLRLDVEIEATLARDPVGLDDLCATASRDTTLAKENPVPLDPAFLRLIAASGLTQFPVTKAQFRSAVNAR